MVLDGFSNFIKQFWIDGLDNVLVDSSFTYYGSKQSKGQQLTLSSEISKSQVNGEVSEFTHLEQK